MIYIGTTESSGQAVYLDIRFIDHTREGTRVSAVVGDGCYEGEVLIECGRQPSVTYVDAWLGGAGLDEFLQRCGHQWLQQQLVESIEDRIGQTRTTPGRQLRLFPHATPSRQGRVAEHRPFWRMPA
jgi:hypothetical protein